LQAYSPGGQLYLAREELTTNLLGPRRPTMGRSIGLILVKGRANHFWNGHHYQRVESKVAGPCRALGCIDFYLNQLEKLTTNELVRQCNRLKSLIPAGCGKIAYKYVV
jgi:hypothetical protein